MSSPFDPGRLGGLREMAAKRLNQLAEEAQSDEKRRRWAVLAAGDAWIRSAHGVGEAVEGWVEEMDEAERREFIGRMAQAWFAWVLLDATTKAIENPRDEALRDLVWEMMENRPRIWDLGGPPDDPLTRG